MKYAAIVFDLFGTLVSNFPAPVYEQMCREMALVLGVPADDFVRWWFGTFDQRMLGIFMSTGECVEYICRQIGIVPGDEGIREAARIRNEVLNREITPRPDAVQTLSYLKSEGYKLGLISDSSGEVPEFWSDSPFGPYFDVTIFSCLEGIKKPDPGIYILAVEQLAVRPEECLYIGDGSSDELTGAANAGMHPVLIRVPCEDEPGVPRIDPEQWNGPRISSLTEVLTLLE